jgi:hypothetical protein
MLRRIAALTASLGLVLAVASGCAGEPEPVETTPSFATDEEAFAAAEETYRAYVDALNQNRRDPASADPQAFLISLALESDIDTQNHLQAAGWSIAGDTSVRSFEGQGSSATGDTVEVTVCLDVSGTRVHDEAGNDITPAERDDLIAIDVVMTLIDTEFMISESTTALEQTC